MATGATHINPDHSQYRTMNLDTALGNSLGLDDTMVPGGNTGHLYLYGLCYGVPSSLQLRVGFVKDLEPLFRP